MGGKVPTLGKQIPMPWNESFPETLIILLNKLTGYYTNLAVNFKWNIIISRYLQNICENTLIPRRLLPTIEIIFTLIF